MLVGYALLVLFTSELLVRLDAPTSLQMLLLGPVLLAAPFYPRRVYLTMLVILDLLSLWLVQNIVVANLTDAYQTMAVLSLTTILVAEGFYRLSRGRLRADEAMRESEARYRHLVEHLSEAILVHSEGKVVYVNPAAQQLFGATEPSQLLGIPVLSLTHASFKKTVQERIHRIEQEQQVTERMEQQVVRLDGTVVSVEVTAAPATYQGRSATQVLLHDITAKKQAAAMIQQAEEHYRSLFNEAPVMYLLTHNAGGQPTITDCNQTFLSTLGYSHEEVLGQPLAIFYSAGSRAILLSGGYEQALSGTFVTAERELLTRTGRAIPALLHASPDVDRAGQVIGTRAMFMDISDRKQAEHALTYERDLLNALMDNIPDTIYFKDTNSRFTRINKAQVRVLGVATAEEAIGRSDFDFQDPMLALGFREEEKRIMGVGELLVDRLEYNPTPDGDPRWFSATKVPLKNQAGKVIGMVGVSRDITERVLTEQALQHRLRFEELITSLSSNLINVAPSDLDQTLSQAIRTIGEFVGADRSYIFLFFPETNTLNNTHEWCAEGIEPQIDHLQDIPADSLPWWQEKLSRFENIHITRVASLPPDAVAERELLEAQDICSLVVVPMRFGNTLRGFLGFDAVHEERVWSDDTIALLKIIGEMFISVLERTRTEQALQEQRNFALRVMNTMGQGLTVTNAAGNFEYVNPAYAHMLGFEAAALIGFSPFDLTLEEDHAAIVEGRALRSEGHGSSYEARLRRADGSLIHVLITAVPRWHQGVVIGSIAVVTDLSERKRMEEVLAKARDQALESSRLKSEFLATMSHEIRTPMNAIIGMAELLLDTPLSEEQQEFAQIVNEAAQGLLTIINDILDFSRIEAGKILLEQIEFEPLHIVEGVAEVLAARARDKGLSLMTFVSPDIPRVLHGDPGRLRQVLLNLVSNAVKFTARGEVDVQASLLARDAEQVTLHFSISDTGIGLSETARRRLFQPFTQADGSTTRQYGGSGLGLSISKRLVEIMGGEIGMESVEGKGSTFWFTVRFDWRPDSSVPLVRQDLEHLKVLIVDDSPTNLKILRRYIRSWGMEETVATSGSAALKRLQQATLERPFDLVIMDLMMPGMDGFALARAIQRNPRIASIHLILLTAHEKRGQGEQALRMGFSAYLTKPIKQSLLLDAIADTMLARTPVPHPSPASSLHAEPPRPNGQQHTLLLAEDNPANQRLAIRQLNKLGYQVYTATNGREALDLYLGGEVPFQLILMDCHMPEMDGFEATRAIRKAEAVSGTHIPIIAMTANAMMGDRETCIAAGMDDYISKPVTLQRLRDVLAQWVPLAPPASAPPTDDKSLREQEMQTNQAEPLDQRILAQLYELQEGSEDEPHIVLLLIDIFLNDTPTTLATLRLAVAEQNADRLHKTAHSLKGSCATIGALTLADYARELETCGRDEKLQKAGMWLERVEAEYERVRLAMRAERAKLE